MESYLSSVTISLVELKTWPDVIILSFLYERDFTRKFLSRIIVLKHTWKNTALLPPDGVTEMQTLLVSFGKCLRDLQVSALADGRLEAEQR